MSSNQPTVKGSIRGKILTPLLLMEVVFVVIFICILVYTSQRNIRESSMQIVQNVHGIYDSILGDDFKTLSVGLNVFTRSDHFKKLFLEKNRAKLIDAGKDLFQANRDQYGITHFYYIENDGNCFLRMHSPELFNDKINRITFKQAQATGKLAGGIELGKTAFALRVVTPYVLDNKQIGYVEFGEEINHFDKIIKTETGSNVLVLVKKDDLDENEYRTTLRNKGAADDWNDLKKYVVVSDTFGDRKFFTSTLFDQREVDRVTSPRYLGTARYKGRILMKGAFPLTDIANKPVGVVLVLSDITNQVKTSLIGLAAFIGAALCLFLGSFLFTYRYLNRQIINPLTDLARRADKVSMGDVSMKIETERMDEVGILFRSFERMRTSLKKSMDLISKGK